MSVLPQLRPLYVTHSPRSYIPVGVVDDCKEHVEENEETAEDVEDEEPGTLWDYIEIKTFFWYDMNLPTGVALYIALKSKSPRSDLTKVYLRTD